VDRLFLIDAFFAFAIAGWLVWQVVPVAKNAVNMLMDRELDDSERENILTIARSHPQVSDVHDLRTVAPAVIFLLSCILSYRPT
jgi:ferrous-iron efflux pump FieF